MNYLCFVFCAISLMITPAKVAAVELKAIEVESAAENLS